MSTTIADAVFSALARQLRLPPEGLRLRGHDALDRLGLDSHGLLRVLIDIERQLGLPNSLDLPDAALASPTALIDGIRDALATR